MKRLLFTLLTTGAAVFTLLGIVAAPASAAGQSAMNIDCGPGILTITGAGSMGPTNATYSAPCTGSQVGQAQFSGAIQVTGPGDCGGGFGFAAAHTDTITSAHGDTLTISITENSCQSATNPSVFNCAGTYTVTAATGKLAGFVGTQGKWGGQITFAGFGVGDRGTFHSTYSN